MVDFGSRELLNAAPVQPLCYSSQKCCQGVLAASEHKGLLCLSFGIAETSSFGGAGMFNRDWELSREYEKEHPVAAGNFFQLPEITGSCFRWEEGILPGLELLNAALWAGQSLHRLMFTCFFSLYDRSGTEINLENLLIEQIKLM